jgi:hypothetical protein
MTGSGMPQPRIIIIIVYVVWILFKNFTKQHTVLRFISRNVFRIDIYIYQPCSRKFKCAGFSICFCFIK